MSKQEFLIRLRKSLHGLPKAEIEERLNFYSEMIDDRIEDGIKEEDAIKEIGDINEIVTQIISDTSLTKIVKEKIKPKKRLSALEITLLVIGSPIWLSLLVALFAVIFSLGVTLWCVIISFWSVFASFVGCAFGGVVAGIGLVYIGKSLTGMAMIGIGIFSIGLSILLFFGCKAATKGVILLSKKIVFGIKNCFIKKGDA